MAGIDRSVLRIESAERNFRNAIAGKEFSNLLASHNLRFGIGRKVKSVVTPAGRKELHVELHEKGPGGLFKPALRIRLTTETKMNVVLINPLKPAAAAKGSAITTHLQQNLIGMTVVMPPK